MPAASSSLSNSAVHAASSTPTNTKASQASQGSHDATKSRILTHMNKDHRLSLFDYINHFLHREVVDPTDPNCSVELVDIGAEYMTLKYTYPGSPNEQLVQIPFNPPMRDDSLQEARPVLVRMAKEAAEARGYSVVQVSKFLPLGSGPTAPFDLMVVAMTMTIVVPSLKTFFWRDFVGSTLFGWTDPIRDVAQWSPVLGGLVNFVANRPWATIGALYSLHAFEAVTVMAAKTRKYRVPAPQRYGWVLTTVVEGFPAILRFNRVVKDQKN